MALAAAQVVDAIAALLVPVSLSGGRVYTSRFWPLTVADLPAWKVTAEDEPIDGELHDLSVNAAGYVHATADADDAMNALAAQGLTALFANPPYALRCVGIERDNEGAGEAAMGVVRLRLVAQFISHPSTPEVIE
jgi:hypothetical protein